MRTMSLGLAESLQALVRSKYASAKASQALTFASSQLALVDVGGLRVRLYEPSISAIPKHAGNADSNCSFK